MKSIPTRFRGVEFRSRLEARWAAFFDLAGWAWDYEPLDLKGWAPDFRVGGRGTSVYVEVKPVEADEDMARVPSFAKAVAHAKTLPILLLGLAPRGLPHLPVGTLLSADPALALFFTVTRSIALWRKAGNAVQWRGQARSYGALR